MEEFNENPFKKDTPVKPFSNGTDYDIWHCTNCALCDKYESKSKTEEEAGCKLSYYLDLGTITGTIPLWVAKDIGCEYDPLYLYARLYKRCRAYEGKDIDTTYHDALRERVEKNFMPWEELVKRKSDRMIVYIRQVCAFLLRMNTKLSLSEIGNILGIDHATVLYSCKQVKNALQGYNNELKSYYEILKP